MFLIDTTSSMQEEISNFRASLRESIVPALSAELGTATFSVASLADFAVPPYGRDIDEPFVLLQPATDDVERVAAALDRLPRSGGGDPPESQVEALFQVATGEGLGDIIPPVALHAQ